MAVSDTSTELNAITNDFELFCIVKEAHVWELEAFDFIILKVVGLSLVMEDVPSLKFPTEERVTNPVLHVELKAAHEVPQRHGTKITTLITTSERLQPIITVLWKLKGTGRVIDIFQGTMSPRYPSDLSLSLNFKVSTSVRVTTSRRMRKFGWWSKIFKSH
jgi:hypothetical protein